MNGLPTIIFMTLPKKLAAGYPVRRKCIKQKNGDQNTLKETGADKVFLQECNVPHWVSGGKDEAKFKCNGQ